MIDKMAIDVGEMMGVLSFVQQETHWHSQPVYYLFLTGVRQGILIIMELLSSKAQYAKAM